MNLNRPCTRVWSRISMLCAVSFLSLSLMPLPQGEGVEQSNLNNLLERLDNVVAERQTYVDARMSRITLLEQMLERDDVDDEQAYSLGCQLFSEYRSFRFDDAVTTLKRTLRIAEKMQSAERKRETNIRLANLYTNAGMYIEANAILSHSIDTIRIDRNGLRDYYLARRRLYYEIYDHSKEPELADAAWRQYNYYVSLLFGSGKENLFADNFAMSNARLSHLIHIYCYAEAEEIAKEILSQCDEYSHRYAIVAYKLATIYEQTQQYDLMLEWYTRSATADILTATKDNASMCCLANHLFGRNDVQRAFHYIRLSMDDAIYYNSKLRPWQVAQSMSNIEGVAAEMEATRVRRLRGEGKAYRIVYKLRKRGSV